LDIEREREGERERELWRPAHSPLRVGELELGRSLLLAMSLWCVENRTVGDVEKGARSAF